jgi:hypothetical protein
MVNDFSLHNQGEIYSRVFELLPGRKRSLFDSLLKIKIYFLSFD